MRKRVKENTISPALGYLMEQETFATAGSVIYQIYELLDDEVFTELDIRTAIIELTEKLEEIEEEVRNADAFRALAKEQMLLDWESLDEEDEYYIIHQEACETLLECQIILAERKHVIECSNIALRNYEKYMCKIQ